MTPAEAIRLLHLLSVFHGSLNRAGGSAVADQNSIPANAVLDANGNTLLDANGNILTTG
jgi:hypothetical protein